LNHAEILPFLISFFILSQVSTKNNRKLRARTESLPRQGNVINLRPVHLFYAKKRQNKCSW